MTTRWFVETVDSGYGQRFAVDALLFEAQSAFQQILIFNNRHFGGVLVLDGAIQTTELDEAAYHEMLVHPALLHHADPERVLIIGGGDGGSLREVLRHPVAEVVMVEIDGAVVEACAQHLPGLSAGAFDDPRVDLQIADGLAYVERAEIGFDVIIIDGTDPTGPGDALFSSRFFKACRKALCPGGIFVNQAGMPLLNRVAFQAGWAALRTAFPHARPYVTPVASYSGGPLAIGSVGLAPQAFDQARYEAMASELSHFTPALGEAAFALPSWLERV